MADELATLRAALDAGNDAFNRADAEGWLGLAHPDAVMFQGSSQTFAPVSAIRPLAESMLAASPSFSVSDVDGRVVGDTAVLFGRYEFSPAQGAAPEVGSFSMTFARTEGVWRSLFSHYTPEALTG